MRVIKFRVWDKSLKKLMTWNPFIRLDDNEYVIQQFTGLLDKNGKEIYEGDIVSFEDQEYGSRETGEIIFNNGSFGSYWEERGIKSSLILNRGWRNHCEVIGNIFENPDLLK